MTKYKTLEDIPKNCIQIPFGDGLIFAMPKIRKCDVRKYCVCESDEERYIKIWTGRDPHAKL